MAATDLRGEIARIFADMRADLDERERRALALLDAGTAGPEVEPARADDPDWGSMKDAAYLRQCTVETMTHHVVSRGLGLKVDGRWRVDLNRVRAWLRNEPITPLNSQSPEDEFDVFRGRPA